MAVAEVGYGAASISLSPLAKKQLAEFNQRIQQLVSVSGSITRYLISTEAQVKGAPTPV